MNEQQYRFTVLYPTGRQYSYSVPQSEYQISYGVAVDSLQCGSYLLVEEIS